MPDRAVRHSDLQVGLVSSPQHWGDRPGDAPHAALVRSTQELGLWIFLCTVAMLFAAFTSAYLVRSAASDWRPLTLPGILWLNTLVLICSSASLEIWRHRKGLDKLRRPGGLMITVVLGAAFLFGQLLGWRELAAQGIFLPSNPHSSFFYILTGLHGLHLVAGLLLLIYLWLRTLKGTHPPGKGSDLSRLGATYWHFMGALWIYVLAVLSLG